MYAARNENRPVTTCTVRPQMKMKQSVGFTLLVLAAVAIWKNEATYSKMPSVGYTAWRIRRTFLSYGGKLSYGKHFSSLKKVDLLFVLDRSGSIGQNNFKYALDFIASLVKHFSISPSTTRVALISYATTVKVEFNFKEHLNKECLLKALKDVQYTGGATATGNALQKGIELYQDPNSGARPNAKRIVFVITDGNTNVGVKPKIPADQLRAAPLKAKVFALGIGTSVNEAELVDIAGSSSHVFRAKNYQILKKIAHYLGGWSFHSCYGCGIRYDECGRKCECKYGKLVNCCRVRKDFTSMSNTERRRYIAAIKLVSTTQPYKARYDTLIGIHRQNFFIRIHTVDEFLPWHRWYIWELENLLREVDCRVTVPYWDWSLWAHDPWSPNLPSLWHASNRGFGGNGSPPGGCVNTGPFRQAVWSTTTGVCLRRNFNGMVPDAAQVQFALNINNFNSFESFLRINLHNLVHCLIDGTMCTIDSANAPEFFMHHGFIDKIWYDWQKKSAVNKYAHFLNINQKLQASPYYPRDFIDIADQPKCVKVCYAEPRIHKAKIVRQYLSGLTKRQVVGLRRLPFSKLSDKVLDAFHVPMAERKTAYKMEKQSWMGISHTQARKYIKTLKGVERILGFKLPKQSA
ncbi:uncharacterized protein LOC135692930 [Rhopilema esculentum]|uniref:uncharacterized protein LOC135692930 n=1 Tax=Rhopilema esculentum TaxID=499914 RepID=UPI0031D5A273|eukprot:gene2106-17684_t